MTFFRLVAVTAFLMAGSSCSTMDNKKSSPASFDGLEGTSWQLVAIKSIDDAQSVLRPDDPAKYILDFASNGELSARLDCNRATGNWRNEIVETNGGSLAFGPMAVTKALCPEPTLGETLERRLPDVRSFLIEDGKMHMAMVGEGGILVWEPAED